MDTLRHHTLLCIYCMKGIYIRDILNHILTTRYWNSSMFIILKTDQIKEIESLKQNGIFCKIFHRRSLSSFKGGMPGVWEITLFSVSSQIHDHLCVWKFSLNSKLLGDKDCLHWIYGQLKKTPFSFTFP